MPRNLLELPDSQNRVEYLSILDSDGKADAELDPGLSDDLLLRLYRAMLGAREFDARLLSLQRQGRVGTFPPITGQEASQLGPAAALREDDWLVPSFREGAAEVWRGRTMESILLAVAGYNEGGYVPPGVNNLPISIPVGSQALHAAGLAWAMKYRNTDQVAMGFFGDGATSEGDVHEALNMAGVYQAPAIFVCQNNHWAISIPRKSQTRSFSIAQKAIAYGIPGIQVDGNDILATYTAAAEAVARARAGEGPTLIECVTYRMMMHTTADDPKKYRTEEEVEKWKARDPIRRFAAYLTAKGLANEDKTEAMKAEIKEEIDAAVKRAEEKMKEYSDPLDMFDHLYAELPERVAEQREALAKELAGSA